MKSSLLAFFALGLISTHAIAQEIAAFPSTPQQESGSISNATLSGPFTSSQTGQTLKWYRNGNMITLVFPSVSVACTSSSAAVIVNGGTDVLGSLGLTPPATLALVAGRIQDNGSFNATPGYIQIGSDGSLSVKKNGTATDLFNTSGNNCGFAAFSVTYAID